MLRAALTYATFPLVFFGALAAGLIGVHFDAPRGILLIAFGLAFISLGMLIPHDEPDAFRGMLGVSSFPIILGAAYLGLWRFSHD